MVHRSLIAGRAPYPYEELEEIWRDILLVQFHDILPGSSIAMVNDEAIASLDAPPEAIQNWSRSSKERRWRCAAGEPQAAQ